VINEIGMAEAQLTRKKKTKQTKQVIRQVGNGGENERDNPLGCLAIPLPRPWISGIDTVSRGLSRDVSRGLCRQSAK
jgi:hypothetical protein